MTEKTLAVVFGLMCLLGLAAKATSFDVISETGNVIVKIEQVLHQCWVEAMNENTER